MNHFYITLILTVVSAAASAQDSVFVSYIADPSRDSIALYWKDDNGEILRSLGNLKQHVEKSGHTLLMGMNGGMYQQDNTALGLFIDNGKIIKRINNASAKGNFYMKPNGVFYLTREKKAVVCQTSDFKQDDRILLATQSGPMLLIDGEIHPAFVKGSANLNIRNGVGILPDGKVVFAISRVPVNFYDFAQFFKNLKCRNALYLDGFVSRAYIHDQPWKQRDGDFGVMIGVIR